MAQTAEQLNSLLHAKYNALDDMGEIAISTSALAEAVYQDIDPMEVSPMLVRVAAVLELRQLARAVCRRTQPENEWESDQGNLFDGKLQDRYPAQRAVDGALEDVYVLRSHLTLEERRYNIARLRQESDAKAAHADLLQAETDHLFPTSEDANGQATNGYMDTVRAAEMERVL